MNNGIDNYSIQYDPIGNRQLFVINAVTNVYTSNDLNQHTSIMGGAAASPTYDSDGNMTFNGSWHHSWDGENRLVTSEPHSATNGSLMFEYKLDHKSRCVELFTKQLSGRTTGYPFDPSGAGTWDTVETRRYIWHDYNIIAEIVSTNNSSFSTHHFIPGVSTSPAACKVPVVSVGC